MTDNTTDAHTAPAGLEPRPPSWYPLADWESDPDGWYFVPPADRAGYAAVPLDDANVRRWLTPSKAMAAGVVTDDLPDGLRWVDVGDGIGPDGEPARLGYLHSDGGMAAVAAYQHGHALAEVRQDRESAAMAAAADAASRVSCIVCRERPYRWEASTVAGGHVCTACAPALALAIAQIAATRVLADGRTVADAALTAAGGFPPGATITPPAGSPDLSAFLTPGIHRPSTVYVGPAGEPTPVPVAGR